MNDFNLNYYDEGFTFDDKLYTGKCYTYFNSKKKEQKHEINFIDGKKDGLYSSNDTFGFPNVIRNFKEGKYHGNVKRYVNNINSINNKLTFNNVLWEDENYIYGSENGEQKFYYIKSGKIRAIINYKSECFKGQYFNSKDSLMICNKKKVGYWVYYYENGNKKLQGRYSFQGSIVDDLLDGEWIFYNEDGGINKRGVYKNGELISGESLKEIIESVY